LTLFTPQTKTIFFLSIVAGWTETLSLLACSMHSVNLLISFRNKHKLIHSFQPTGPE